MNITTSRKNDATESDSEHLQIVWAEVYAPMMPDAQGDFMTAETIRDMAYRFMAERKTGMIDLMHNNRVIGCYVVESFIAREGDPDFLPGGWVLGVKIPDTELWQAILDNTYNGFSLEALSTRTEVELEVEFVPEVTGQTSVDEEHSHTFTVEFDQDGNFLGGRTGVTLGHSHEIKRGTVTEYTDGHRHKFVAVEGMGTVYGDADDAEV